MFFIPICAASDSGGMEFVMTQIQQLKQQHSLASWKQIIRSPKPCKRSALRIVFNFKLCIPQSSARVSTDFAGFLWYNGISKNQEVSHDRYPRTGNAKPQIQIKMSLTIYTVVRLVSAIDNTRWFTAYVNSFRTCARNNADNHH